VNLCVYVEAEKPTDKKAVVFNLALGNRSRKFDILACWKMGTPCRHAWHKEEQTVEIWKAQAPNIMFSWLKLSCTYVYISLRKCLAIGN